MSVKINATVSREKKKRTEPQARLGEKEEEVKGPGGLPAAPKDLLQGLTALAQCPPSVLTIDDEFPRFCYFVISSANPIHPLSAYFHLFFASR